MIKRIVLFLIRFYQMAISPYNRGVCRFEPTCSVYAYQAIERHGLVKGILLATKRILKCNFINKNYGYDPVPDSCEIKKSKKDKTKISNVLFRRQQIK